MSASATSASSTATRTAVYDPTNPATALLAVNMSNVTRLTNTNYLMWSKQIQALLEGHELHTFLEKTTSTPELSSPTMGSLNQIQPIYH